MTRLLLPLLAAIFVTSPAQAQAPGQLLEQALTAHLRGGPVASITASGQLTTTTGSSPITIQARGNDTFRIEQGTGASMRVRVSANGAAWAGSRDKLDAVPPRIGVRRPSMFPFLDLVSEARNPRAVLTYRGVVTLPTGTAYRISIRLPDEQATEREYRKGLDEELDVYLDVATFVIVRTDRPVMAAESSEFRTFSIMQFSDFRLVQGVLVPYRVLNTIGRPEAGFQQSTLVFSEVTINPSLPDSLFATPGGAR